MINRKQVVERHYPKLGKIEPLSPLSVGNGEFAFTADITGLQTFPDAYEVPLGTQSQWGWHYTDRPDLFNFRDIVHQKFKSQGRDVSYPLYPEEKAEAFHWLRQNPHKLQLGQISFQLLKENNEKAEIGDIKETCQLLDLWEGTLHSDFSLEGKPVSVTTICHPGSDQIGVKVISPLIATGRLQVIVRFPSPDMISRIWEESTFLDWENTGRHQTILQSQSKHSALFIRTLDEDSYKVKWTWNSGNLECTDMHEFTLFPEPITEELSFSIGFAMKIPETHAFMDMYTLSQNHWKQFWTSGAAIDLSESSDLRALELERRIVLSQYLTAIHSGGSVPPQETGLMYNSWFGKLHLEMHWWHAAQFPLWGRANILEKSLDWYTSILPLAKDLAKSQGYNGARWPKMVGFDGEQSPSAIAPVLIWQQPHPIFMAELCYQSEPSHDKLIHLKDIVIETANFMTSFAEWDEEKKAYILGPPLIPAQECHMPEQSLNPTFELEYWKFGLETAIKWVERLNESPDSKWSEIANAMAKPAQAEGVYLAHENCSDTFTKYNHDHPSMVGALGILPGSLIDPQIMKNTLQKVREGWKWDTAWGWDFPMCAMTAARLGDGSMAVDFLLMNETKNTYLTNGHNYQDQTLTAYLPGNGGLLTAVAMMACGWSGESGKHAPGFPQDGTWSVKWEGLQPIL